MKRMNFPRRREQRRVAAAKRAARYKARPLYEKIARWGTKERRKHRDEISAFVQGRK